MFCPANLTILESSIMKQTVRRAHSTPKSKLIKSLNKDSGITECGNEATDESGVNSSDSVASEHKGDVYDSPDEELDSGKRNKKMHWNS